ncbi:T9SS type A sorting domain-containing protein [Maribacter sp. 2-571]|uniref:T9SS type A sorting domain-containing protein n=1 Tax=Maribacter sp. 2-571 TaxID=3417569 RepID=UPI003D35885A
MKFKRLSNLFLWVFLGCFGTQMFAAGWCGQSKKEDCGDWVVQMAVFNGGAMGSNDCVSYNNCVTWAQWDWSNTGAWSQLLLEKEGFCDKNYRLSNTKDFKVSYNGSFSNAYGNHRLAIVSWGKTTDDCDWRTDNLYELYVHEKSYEENNYASWCKYIGETPNCSGSTYKMYDCEYQILGRSIRCWRNSPRTSGTTDIDCLWEAWRSKGIAPDVYYYFTEVGAEVGPDSGGRFTLTGNDMQRVAESSNPTPPPSGGNDLIENGIYRLKCSWGGKYLHATNDKAGSNVDLANKDNSQWSQQWVAKKVSNGVYRFYCRWGGKYLHATGDKNNANVTLNNLNTGWSSQKWKLKKDGGIYRLEVQWGKNNLTADTDKNGGNAKVHAENTSWSSQKWTLEYTGETNGSNLQASLAPEGEYEFASFPNPSTDFISIEGLDEFSVKIFSLDGRLLMERDNMIAGEKVAVGNLPTGVHLMQVSSAGTNVRTEKIVIE